MALGSLRRCRATSSLASTAPTARGYNAPDSAHGYCLQLLKAYDHENYLINLVLPNRVRRVHAAIRAFNVELVRIRDAVTHEDHGRIRIAWYRTALDSALFQQPSKAPVIQAVAQVLTSTSLTSHDAALAHRSLLDLLDARELDLAYRKLSTIKELEGFTDQTQGSILRATVAATRPKDTPHDWSDQMLSASTDFGKAYGLTVMLRGIPYNAGSRISYVPEELVTLFNSSYSHLIKNEPTEETRQIIKQIADRAEKHLVHGRAKAHALEKYPPPETAPLDFMGTSCVSSRKFLQDYVQDLRASWKRNRGASDDTADSLGRIFTAAHFKHQTGEICSSDESRKAFSVALARAEVAGLLRTTGVDLETTGKVVIGAERLNKTETSLHMQPVNANYSSGYISHSAVQSNISDCTEFNGTMDKPTTPFQSPWCPDVCFGPHKPVCAHLKCRPSGDSSNFAEMVYCVSHSRCEMVYNPHWDWFEESSPCNEGAHIMPSNKKWPTIWSDDDWSENVEEFLSYYFNETKDWSFEDNPTCPECEDKFPGSWTWREGVVNSSTES